MRTTIDLSDELLRAAKARAASQGESLKTFLTRAVESALGEPDETRKAGRVRLPLFGDPAGPKAKLTDADIKRVLEEEDLEYVRRTRGRDEAS
jgi:hypothetical protein